MSIIYRPFHVTHGAAFQHRLIGEKFQEQNKYVIYLILVIGIRVIGTNRYLVISICFKRNYVSEIKHKIYQLQEEMIEFANFKENIKHIILSFTDKC